MRKAIAAVIVAGIALAAAGSARADRLLLAPTGRQLGAFEAKYEAVFHGGEGSYQWLQVGIPRVELQVMRENPLHGGTATGFAFDLPEASALGETIARACELYGQHPKVWSRVQQNAMRQDFGWRASARHYAELYETLAR